MIDPLPMALEYLDHGWSVIPCHVSVDRNCSCGRETCNWPGKHPRVAWRQYCERLPTRKEVTTWFRDEFYMSNIGIVTGKVSGLAVVDVDKTQAAYDALALPRTLEVLTGGGGRHYYFRILKPMSSRIGMVDGIDLKADGGFVVCPPSVHQSGRHYMWRWSPDRLPLLSDRELPIGGKAGSNDLCWYDDLLAGVSEGERSVTAAKLAGRYATLGLTRLETFLLLTGWNEANKPALEIAELKATVNAVYRKHSTTNGGSTIQSMEGIYQIMRSLTGRDV